MDLLTNKEYEKYQEYRDACLYGRCLTPDGLRMLAGWMAIHKDEPAANVLRFPKAKG